TLQIDFVAFRPVSDACGEVERQSRNAIVLPLSGVFSKHDAPGRHVVGTPSHGVFIAADTPYRIGFPGPPADRALALRFDDSLVPEQIASHGLLGPDAMMRRNLLCKRLQSDEPDRFEAETLGLELLYESLKSMRADKRPPRRSALT